MPIIHNAPWIQLREEVKPRDLVGIIDFCAGEVRMKFDASFIPNTFGIKSEPISVVMDLTTGVSKGDFREVEGRPLDGPCSLRPAGVAKVPKTGGWFINALLSLPTDAVTEMDARFEFLEGRFECPARTQSVD